MSKSENFIEKYNNVFITKIKNDKKLLRKIKIDSSSKIISILKLLDKHKIIILIFLFLLYSTYYLPNPCYHEIEKYIKFNLAGNLIHSTHIFFKRDNPKISIVISTFNGEVYLKPVVRSIQNQNFLNIEITTANDGSMDKTVNVVKDLMEEDRRIKLISNAINRGTLYTKTRGVLNSKGKYIMTLDHDNLYSTNYVFSRLYSESENYNLDLLGFSTISTPVEIKNIKDYNSLNYFETPIIRKPNIKRIFIGFIKSEESGLIYAYILLKQNYF